jgi:hypothetical protein
MTRGEGLPLWSGWHRAMVAALMRGAAKAIRFDPRAPPIH